MPARIVHVVSSVAPSAADDWFPHRYIAMDDPAAFAQRAGNLMLLGETAVSYCGTGDLAAFASGHDDAGFIEWLRDQCRQHIDADSSPEEVRDCHDILKILAVIEGGANQLAAGALLGMAISRLRVRDKERQFGARISKKGSRAKAQAAMDRYRKIAATYAEERPKHTKAGAAKRETARREGTDVRTVERAVRAVRKAEGLTRET